MTRAVPYPRLLLLTLGLGACAAWDDEATLALQVRGSRIERDLARQRILELPLPTSEVERWGTPEGGELRVVGRTPVSHLMRDLPRLQGELLQPPAGRGWRLLVRARTSTSNDARWQEWTVTGPEASDSQPFNGQE